MLARLPRQFRPRGLAAWLALSTLVASAWLGGCEGTPGLDPPAQMVNSPNAGAGGTMSSAGTGASNAAGTTATPSMDAGASVGGSGGTGAGAAGTDAVNAGSGGGAAGTGVDDMDGGIPLDGGDAGDAGDAGDEDADVTH